MLLCERLKSQERERGGSLSQRGQAAREPRGGKTLSPGIYKAFLLTERLRTLLCTLLIFFSFKCAICLFVFFYREKSFIC